VKPVVLYGAADCHGTWSPAPCHLRPSDKKQLAAINAAKRAAAEQRALNERINLLTVSYLVCFYQYVWLYFLVLLKCTKYNNAVMFSVFKILAWHWLFKSKIFVTVCKICKKVTILQITVNELLLATFMN